MKNEMVHDLKRLLRALGWFLAKVEELPLPWKGIKRLLLALFILFVSVPLALMGIGVYPKRDNERRKKERAGHRRNSA